MQHTRAVGDLQQQVELCFDLVDRSDRPDNQLPDGRALRPRHLVLHGVDEITEDRGGGGSPAGAAPVEHQLADGVALDEDRVERAAHRRERMRERDHRRVDAHGHVAVDFFGDGQQLDDVAQRPRRRDVVDGHARDALAVDVVRRDAGAEGDAGNDRGFGGRVEAFDVGGRVGLGVPELLGFGQRVVERRAGLGHGREDVVGRSVDDAHDPADAITGERFTQRPQQRYPARD